MLWGRYHQNLTQSFFLIVKVTVRLNGSGAVSVNVYFVYSIIYKLIIHKTTYTYSNYIVLSWRKKKGDAIK